MARDYRVNPTPDMNIETLMDIFNQYRNRNNDIVPNETEVQKEIKRLAQLRYDELMENAKNSSKIFSGVLGVDGDKYKMFKGEDQGSLKGLPGNQEKIEHAPDMPFEEVNGYDHDSLLGNYSDLARQIALTDARIEFMAKHDINNLSDTTLEDQVQLSNKLHKDFDELDDRIYKMSQGELASDTSHDMPVYEHDELPENVKGPAKSDLYHPTRAEDVEQSKDRWEDTSHSSGLITNPEDRAEPAYNPSTGEYNYIKPTTHESMLRTSRPDFLFEDTNVKAAEQKLNDLIAAQEEAKKANKSGPSDAEINAAKNYLTKVKSAKDYSSKQQSAADAKAKLDKLRAQRNNLMTPHISEKIADSYAKQLADTDIKNERAQLKEDVASGLAYSADPFMQLGDATDPLLVAFKGAGLDLASLARAAAIRSVTNSDQVKAMIDNFKNVPKTKKGEQQGDIQAYLKHAKTFNSATDFMSEHDATVAKLVEKLNARSNLTPTEVKFVQAYNKALRDEQLRADRQGIKNETRIASAEEYNARHELDPYKEALAKYNKLFDKGAFRNAEFYKVGDKGYIEVSGRTTGQGKHAVYIIQKEGDKYQVYPAEETGMSISDTKEFKKINKDMPHGELLSHLYKAKTDYDPIGSGFPANQFSLNDVGEFFKSSAEGDVGIIDPEKTRKKFAKNKEDTANWNADRYNDWTVEQISKDSRLKQLNSIWKLFKGRGWSYDPTTKKLYAPGKSPLGSDTVKIDAILDEAADAGSAKAKAWLENERRVNREEGKTTIPGATYDPDTGITTIRPDVGGYTTVTTGKGKHTTVVHKRRADDKGETATAMDRDYTAADYGNKTTKNKTIADEARQQSQMFELTPEEKERALESQRKFTKNNPNTALPPRSDKSPKVDMSNIAKIIAKGPSDDLANAFGV